MLGNRHYVAYDVTTKTNEYNTRRCQRNAVSGSTIKGDLRQLPSGGSQ